VLQARDVDSANLSTLIYVCFPNLFRKWRLSVSSRSLIIWLTDVQVYPEFQASATHHLRWGQCHISATNLRPYVWLRDVKQSERRSTSFALGRLAELEWTIENDLGKWKPQKIWAVRFSRARKW